MSSFSKIAEFLNKRKPEYLRDQLHHCSKLKVKKKSIDFLRIPEYFPLKKRAYILSIF